MTPALKGGGARAFVLARFGTDAVGKREIRYNLAQPLTESLFVGAVSIGMQQ